MASRTTPGLSPPRPMPGDDTTGGTSGSPGVSKPLPGQGGYLEGPHPPRRARWAGWKVALARRTPKDLVASPSGEHLEEVRREAGVSWPAPPPSWASRSKQRAAKMWRPCRCTVQTLSRASRCSVDTPLRLSRCSVSTSWRASKCSVATRERENRGRGGCRATCVAKRARSGQTENPGRTRWSPRGEEGGLPDDRGPVDGLPSGRVAVDGDRPAPPYLVQVVLGLAEDGDGLELRQQALQVGVHLGHRLHVAARLLPSLTPKGSWP